MAETSQINFDLREVATALIRKEGIHEGRWMLGLEFTFGAGNLGAGPTDTKPGAFVQINKLVLTRQAPDAPDLPFIVDAAKVNPADNLAKASAPKKVNA
jgi:hypothetical protein